MGAETTPVSPAPGTVPGMQVCVISIKSHGADEE